ncbi:beta-ketoacyl synthase N-terminal-like domain-containing protein [Streptomyces sp. NPDC023723]|uniref:beta-ketoacyl synthase N-terminal-like domain-containing protein n=1 Tax=Streptomyces sp. NPDC023723 TaxID=3154323 RepID=UPI003408B555
MTPLALVGMSCRVPGAENPTEFWANLLSSTSSVRRAPKERWVFAPATTAPAPVSFGGFLKDPDLFDASFFGISQREAAHLDPQQRLVLELAWEAVEDAALCAGRLRGRRWGVFVGAGSDDFRLRYLNSGQLDRFGHTGTAGCMLANRVSHHFGLRGPSEVIDTGQSSSLAAIHRAMGAVQLGECEAAVVAGVAVNLLGEVTEQIRLWGGLSADGRCHTFDERADGYVRGEGGACVVLKPLDAALRDGDHVYCVVRGSATTNDGDRGALGEPSTQAQCEVLRAAHRAAGVTAADVSYIELHGTGTPVGDPVEAAAIGEAVGRARAAGSPVRVGSVKTNIGHLESAAGVAGLVKAALVLHHGRVPPSLNFSRNNPDIDLEAANIRVVTRTEQGGFSARDAVGVSSFGMGGTHVHVVLGPAPAAVRGGGAEASRTQVPWCLSARSPEALREFARTLLGHPFDTDAYTVADVGRALNGRTQWEHRAVVVGADWDEMRHGLEKVVAGHHFTVPPERPDTDPAVRDAVVRAAAAYAHSGDIEAVRRLSPALRTRPAPLMPTYPFRREPFRLPEPASRAAAPAPSGPDHASFVSRWRAARGGAERSWIVRELLEGELAAVYGGTIPDFDPAASFSDNAIDSMSLLEFLDRLNTATDSNLSEVALFDHPTINELAEYVNKEMEASHG